MLQTPLPRATPESTGVRSELLLELVRDLDAVGGMNSIMIARHGSVIAEGWWAPYAPELRHAMWSVSKSVTSSAIGIAIGEGLLSLDDRVIDHLAEFAPAEVSDNLAAMTIRDCLTMSTGHAVDTVDVAHRDGEHNWAAMILSQPVPLTPGTHFVYNSGATYLLSVILTQVTGERLLDYVGSRIFEPLGIHGATWEQSAQGIDVGGWGLGITTEQLAALGQLWLHRGNWHGTQLIPAEYVVEATSNLVPTDHREGGADTMHGYGYQFWQGPLETYRADGAFGQFDIVFEQHDAVVTMTAGIQDPQLALDVVSKHLAAAFGPEPLDENPSAVAALGALLAKLGIAHPDHAAAPEAGLANAVITFGAEALDRVRIAATGSSTALTFETADSSASVEFGHDGWIDGETAAFVGTPSLIAARGGWASPTRFEGRMMLVETPYGIDVSITVEGDTATIDAAHLVSFVDLAILRATGSVDRGA